MWTQHGRRPRWRGRVSRRAMFRGGGAALAGLTGAVLIGCGDNDTNGTSTSDGTGTPAGGTSTTPVPVSNRGGTIRHARDGFIAGLDPDYSSSGNFYHSLAHDCLLAFDDDGLPGINDMSLATSMEMVDDLTMVLRVRNVKFQDDTDFNAEAVVFNMQRKMQTVPPGGVNITLFTNLANVEAVDDETVRFELDAPVPAMAANLSRAGGLMGSSAHYADKDLSEVRWNPAGTGPWLFDSFAEDQFIRWQAWQDHWRRASDDGPIAQVDTFQYDVIPEEAVLVSALQAGDVEIIESPFTQLSTLDGDPALASTSFTGRSTLSGYVNHALPPTDNLNIRRALAMAWDADAFNRLFYSGAMTPATSILPGHSWAYVDAQLPPYDLEEARTLVEASGVPEEDRVVVVTADSQQFQFLQSAWAEIGIQAEYVPSQDADGRLYSNRGEAADVNINVADFNFRIDPHAQLSLQLSEEGFFNMGAAPVGDIEDLLVAGNSTYDTEERQEIYREIQLQQAENLYAFIPKLELAHIQHHHADVGGILYHPDATPYLAEVGFI